MTHSKHTPAPWSVHESDSIVGEKIDDKEIWLRPVIARFSIGVKDADARLIAAAPELLEALKKMLSTWEHGGVDVYPISEARAAIAKATGA